MRNIILLILLLATTVCRAQSYKLFTTDQELSSSLINHIFQDSNGMIWVATEDGLHRYDGAKFTIYKHHPEDNYSLSHNYVRRIFEDSQGNIYVGTHNGLQLYDAATDKFSKKAVTDNKRPYNQSITNIIERKNGEVWVAGGRIGKINIDEGQPIVTYQTLNPTVNSSDYLFEDSENNLWISQGNIGIYRTGRNLTEKVYLSEQKQINVVDICQDRLGNIYAATVGGRGLMKLNRERDEFEFIPYRNNTKLAIRCICQVNEEELYIGTDGNGVKVYNINTGRMSDFVFDNNSFNSNTLKVHAILKDNAGNLWFGLYQKGVFMLPANQTKFKYLGYKSVENNIIGTAAVTTLFHDKKGTMWVGTDNDGIYTIGRDGKPTAHYASSGQLGSIPAVTLKIYEDSDQNMWIGSLFDGLAKFNRQTGTCTFQKRFVDKNGKNIQHVYDLAEDNRRRLWIATLGNGLYSYNLDKQVFEYDTLINKNMNHWIGCLLYSKTNNILFAGTYNGLFYINFKDTNPIPKELMHRYIIHSLHQDRNGIIWIGSSDGLGRWNPVSGELQMFTTQNGLPSNTIYGIQSDEAGNVWVSTNAGLSRYIEKHHFFKNYYVEDGIQSNEFSKNAATSDGEGNLWFGGTHGITYFKPSDIQRTNKNWTIRITDFYLHNTPVRKGMMGDDKEDIIDCPVFEAKEFHLNHNHNHFSIEFSPTQYNAPEGITYSYTLQEGKDARWNTLPEGLNRIYFNDMKPGTYHLRVRAQDNYQWSNTVEATIYIRPAWYASGWARMLYTLIAIGIIITLIRLDKKAQKRKEEMLKHMHAEQLNEAKLQFFINISHEIRTPMSLIISPLQRLIEKDKDEDRSKIYKTIHRNSERILHLINQLMDIRKIDKGQMKLSFKETDIIAFIQNIYDSFYELAIIKNIDFQFTHLQDESLKLWIDPDNFDKVFVNLLSNAFKFTPNDGKIGIKVQKQTDNTLTIAISDSGIGITDEDKEYIFNRFYQASNNPQDTPGTGVGLHLTQALVELHHGSIEVLDNEEGSGCQFVITMPMGKEHLQPEDVADTAIEKSVSVQEKIPHILLENVAETTTDERICTSQHNLLLVEDNAEIRRYIHEELSECYNIKDCCNGKEALEELFHSPIDLVISDVMMPEMDGMTLCHKIKTNINLNHIPVILLTAKVRDEDRLEALENNADAYITKPFNIEILKKTVASLITIREQLKNKHCGQQSQDDKLEKILMPSHDDKLMERVMKCINRNISNPDFTVNMIADEVGLSRVHLNRKMKELTNQTTRDFIRNVRLKQATTLLIEKKHTIIDVAEMVGFTSANNFSTAFKEFYGMSPTDYVRKHL